MSKYQIFPLESEQEFEELVRDLCTQKYAIEFQLYARRGFGQDGIDGYSISNSEPQIVFQCKNRNNNRTSATVKKKLLEDIVNEVDKCSQGYLENTKTYIFAHSLPRDKRLQDKATELNNKYKFTIIVWSWDEIIDLLHEHKDVAIKYYSTYFSEYPHQICEQKRLLDSDIKIRFKDNSVTLLSSKNLYIAKSFIEVPEINKIINFINTDNFNNQLLVLTGKAGIGKTAILSQIQGILEKQNTVCLSIKRGLFQIALICTPDTYLTIMLHRFKPLYIFSN